jgi:PAS domain S-box-containing protein
MNSFSNANDRQGGHPEQSMRAAIDAIPVQAWRGLPDGSADFLNQRFLDYIGLAATEAMGWGWRQAVHPDDLPIFEKTWDAIRSTALPGESEARLRRFDGVYRWFLFRSEPQHDASGSVVNWYGTNTDIDDLRRAEQRIRDAESELRAVVDTIPGLIWIANSDFLEFLGKQWTELGISLADAGGTKWRRFYHPDDLPQAEQDWREATSTGKLYQNVSRVRRADGEYRWLLHKAVPLRGESGKITRWFGIDTDIEEQKQTEDKLRRSEAYLAYTQQLSQTGSLGWRSDGRDAFWSDETYRIFGYERSIEPSLQRILRLVHPDDIDALRRALDRIQHETSSISIEFRIVSADGTIINLRLLAHAVAQDSDGAEFIGAVIDITAAKRAEEALQRAQANLAHVSRVATLGELTASIAHEVNQPLAGIVTNGEACLRWLEHDIPNLGEARDAVRRMIGDGRRASDVIGRLHALARKDEPQRLPLDINNVVQELLLLVHREMSNHRVVLELQLSPGLPVVLGDPVQLQQVIINLIVNGIQAMADITNRLSVLTISSGTTQTGDVFLAVRDTGHGIGPGILDRLFEAFFTTKANGMGMGLSICRSIIDLHGGAIWATTDEGGSRFQFTLPAHGSNQSLTSKSG